MMMVVLQLLITTLAALGLHQIVTTENKKQLQKQLVKGLIATGAIFLLAIILYISFDYKTQNDKALLTQVKNMGQQQVTDYVTDYVKGIVADRKGMFMEDILRSFGFILLAAGLIFASLKKWINPIVVAIGIALFAFIDVALVNKTYLNAENYQEKMENENVLEANALDKKLIEDNTDYRVFNQSGNRFSENSTSYLFKSVGGYHPAKLRLYQDLIERQLGKPMLNQSVLSMLNTKYIIQKGRKSQNGPVETVDVKNNLNAAGSAWFVRGITFVKDADAEMKALDSFDVKATAFVQEQYKSSITITP
jgi:hypothetical protein